jgi:hypothetical protein
MKLFTRKPPAVDFCDRCGSVCDDNCRARALRQDAVEAALRQRFRIA